MSQRVTYIRVYICHFVEKNFIFNHWKISITNIIVVYYVLTYDCLSKPGATHKNYYFDCGNQI